MDDEIVIIYFIWINKNRNWKVIIEGQLNDIKMSKILEKSYLNIVISCEDHDCVNEAVIIINNLLIDYKNKYSMNIYLENNFEYYGIKKLYECAKNDPNKIYIYFHTKGMFNWYNNKPDERSEDEVNLTNYIIYWWRDILSVLKSNDHINRIGLVPSNEGWIWFNFFYARGNYLNTCSFPIKNSNRYYYESWLGTGNQNIGITYGLYSGNYNKYTGHEAIEIIEKMR